jgi:phytoene dehydrogenase-like protein
LTEKHYDVVVLGRSIGALAAAALLSRRDFRVLVLGQGARPPTYRYGRHVLPRSAFTMLSASSPAFRRLLVELAQTQTFRRRAIALDPMLQVLMPERRIELPPDVKLFEREIEREFPEVRRVIEELYGELARVNAAADAAFEHEAVWPPGTFWERRRAARLSSNLPYTRAEPGVDLLGDLPADHAYRTLTATLLRFAAHVRVEALPPLALARLHGAWTRGLFALARGEDELAEFLLERIQAQGGTCRLSERATRLVVGRAGGAPGVLLDGEATPTGAGFVVTDMPGEQVALLAQGEGIMKSAERDWPRVTPAYARFVVSLVVRSEGLPARLAKEAFVVPANRERSLLLHVVRADPSAQTDASFSAPPEAKREAVLTVEALLPVDKGVVVTSAARERILDALCEAFPFLERHLLLVDSPHDGRPAWVYGPERRDVERIHLTGGSAQAEPMAYQWTFDRPGYLGLAGEPLRGPVARTLLVGSTVLPALGQEGELLAAWSAVHVITRADGQKERIRRAMWSKVEIG